MRPLVLLLILLTSGVLHLGVELVERVVENTVAAAETGAQAADPCCDDDEDCSPACHDCVCSFGARIVVSATPVILVGSSASPPLALSVLTVSAATDVTSPPRPPALAGVFHPPRA